MDAAAGGGRMRHAGVSRRAFIALAPAKTTVSKTMTSDGPTDEAVLRESFVLLGSLASGALSPRRQGASIGS